MTEVELVATALAAGAAPGLTDSGRGAVHDLYAALREAVRRRLAASGGNGVGVGGGYGVRVLDAYETDPDVWRTRLLQVLTASGVETDEECLAAARAVLRAERRIGRITVDAYGAKGVPGTAPHCTKRAAHDAVAARGSCRRAPGGRRQPLTAPPSPSCTSVTSATFMT
ncbi:hypothetical protein GCM10023080_062750 [Streptomyces pseudoechinosporeus]